MNTATKEFLDGILGEAKSRNDENRQKAAQELKRWLEVHQREHSTTGDFTWAYQQALSRAQNAIVNAVDTAERIGGIHIFSALLDIKSDDTAQKVTRFATSLRTIMRGTDTAAMVVAARALGRLTSPGGPLTTELVDSEVKSALEALQVERQENKRFAAVLTLRELANNSPTLLYQYMQEIMEVIWIPLRDPKVLIRESTAEAVSVFFEIIAARERPQRDDSFGKIHYEINKGFQQNLVETVHGSLLALKELLLKGGMFMQKGDRYNEAADKVFMYKDHRELLIRKEVTIIIPILAAYYPQEFSSAYLHKFMIHLQGQLKREKDRNPAFIAIGKVASAVGSAIDPYLDGILVYVREGLSIKARNKSMNDAPIFECISMIAIAVGQTLTKYMEALLDPIFACGLSDALTQALVDMAHYVPPARPAIQEKLLDLLSHVLCGRPFLPLGSPSFNMPPSAGGKDSKDPQYAEHREAEVALALQTLGSFNFSGYILNEFVRDVVLQYVEDDNPAIRRAAALTCCQLFIKDPIVQQVSRHAVQVVGTVIEKLLTVSVADPDPEIRRVVLTSLDPRFDRHLAKAENIRTLFLALNDEVFANREAAMPIIGRLSSVNPAYVFPSLRKVLIQLLTEIEYSNNPRNKQESALLISHLVNSSTRLIKPYVDPIVTVLLPKVSDSDESVAATSMRAIGDLATAGGEDMERYIDELMKLIIKHLQDLSSIPRRNAALRTLGQLASNAGYVIEPYIDHPELLSILVNIVKSEPHGRIRYETIRLLGILGALDPYKHQQLLETSPESQLAAEAQTLNDVALIIRGLTPSSEEYYPTIVITTLMNILKDPSLTQLYNSVIDAVMNIYTTMGLKCVGFLDQVIPGFLHVINEAPAGRVDSYFNQLAQLVKIVRQHIRPFLPQLLETIQYFWHTAPVPHGTILSLIESISRSLEGEFRVYLASILPLMLGVLEDERPSQRGPAERVLRAFLVFESSAEEYMHLIIPAIVRTFERLGQPQPLRRQAIETVARISRYVNISEYASQIIHPLTRILAGNDIVLKQAAVDTLCALAFQLGRDYLHYIPTVNKALASSRVPHSNHTLIVGKLQRGEPLPQDLSPDERYGEDNVDMRPPEISTKMLAVNQEHLKLAWETNQRSTREDWEEWLRRLAVELLKESPQQALRACCPLASVHSPTAKALFNSAFISCYPQLFQNYQVSLVQNIETALLSPNIPPETLTVLLNLAEFMEHDDKALPIDLRTLGIIAWKCHTYAKALHYKEMEFNSEQTPSAVEALISINNHLNQLDAAFGILRKAQNYSDVDLKENWFERLHRWEDALNSYQKREAEEPYSFEVIMGKMRCLHALGEWDVLSSIAEDKWNRAATDGHQRYMAPLAAAAAWGMGQWELMDKYLSAMKSESPDRSFFGAILSIHRNQFDYAHTCIDRARDGLDTELSALLNESYTRAYDVIVRVQMLAELEEVIVYKQNDKNPEKQETMRNTWTKRLKGCQRNIDVWQRMLKVRALVLKPEENMEMWIKFANLCRKSMRFGLAEKSLRSLIGPKTDMLSIPLESPVPHQVNYAILKYMWSAPSGNKEQALTQLEEFTMRVTEEVQANSQALNAASHVQLNGTSANGSPNGLESHGGSEYSEHVNSKQFNEMQTFLAKCHLKQGQWQMALHKDDWTKKENVHEVLSSYAAATRYNPGWYKAWHSWALANFDVVNAFTSLSEKDKTPVSQTFVADHVVPAIQGFLKSIALTSMSSLQDTLRVLTLWFAHGGHHEVNVAITEGMSTVSVNTWLEVIPQLIARIGQPNPKVRQSIYNLLCELGKAHPQALVYPLTVSIKSETTRRSRLALQVMDSMRQHSPKLVEQADMVSHELIRIAVLWHEQWYEGLEEASRLYFGEHNVEAMFACLEPLHDMIEKGSETLRELSFIQSFGRELQEARQCCRAYQRTKDVGDINQAWDVYYQVFKKISRQLPQLLSLEMQYVSPKLKDAHDLDLAVPGTYQSGKPIIRISHFEPGASVYQSKQRPRRLVIKGSDGGNYMFLLKGHEDIRQDERIMQLFGLVNTLLANDPECVKRHLNIQRYSPIPLSTMSGLISWVPNSDTLHVLIREYRESRKILLNIEHRIMLQMAPDYDNLTLMQKVEVFTYAMDNTTGQDLYRVLWLKSKSSESWLDRRTNYIRSLGVMSMVGYIMGLGDRHPSNLMLDRVTGKIVHIDYGDCFEVAMHREKYPERVPFRLTRMLTFAMEVANIEGSFRTTCENVMRVMRDNKESLMAVLEAFIHDPLMTWRLNTRESPPETSFVSERRESLVRGTTSQGPNTTADSVEQGMIGPGRPGSVTGRPRARTRSSVSGARPNINGNSVHNGTPGVGMSTSQAQDPENAKEVQNARAVQVLSRVREKLTGTDFKPTEELGVEEQVDKLIKEATNLENLCQHYIGWCSFW